jgi:hypothetical protein
LGELVDFGLSARSDESIGNLEELEQKRASYPSDLYEIKTYFQISG